MVFDINKSFSKLGSNIIFTLERAFEGIADIISFDDSVDGLSNISRISREFAVTYDEKRGEKGEKRGEREWSIWYGVDETNLNANIDFNEKKFWLKFRYSIVEKFDSNPININNIELSFNLKEGEESPFEEDLEFNIENAIEFNKDANIEFHKLGEGFIQLHNDMNNFLNREYGVDVFYFRTEPDLDTVDSFLNEYSLHHVQNPGGTCIKVVVPENIIPEPKHEYDEWGINFDIFEINISKDYFEEIFGAAKKPRNEDFMYFPFLNRMYYVSSNYLGHGVQESANFYVLSLKKYDENTSVIKDEETQEFLDENTVSHEDIFGDKELAEKQDIVNEQQNSMKTIADDVVRELIHESMEIKDDIVFNNGTILLKHHYDMQAITFDQIAVRYKLSHHLLEGESWGNAQWINIPELDPPTISLNIVDQERVDFNTIKVTFDREIKNVKLKEYDSIVRGNDIYDLISIVNDTTVLINSREDIDPMKLDNYFRSRKHNLHFTINDDITFSINLYDRRKLRIRLNNTLYDFDGLDLDYDKWYAPIINISNEHGYIGVYFWQLEQRGIGDLEKNSTRLINIYKKEISIEKDCIIIPKGSIPFIAGSDMLMSNVRILKQSIDHEFQSFFVGTRNVKNASLAFVIDDGEFVLNVGVAGRGFSYISERIEKREIQELGEDERL